MNSNLGMAYERSAKHVEKAGRKHSHNKEAIEDLHGIQKGHGDLAPLLQSPAIVAAYK